MNWPLLTTSLAAALSALLAVAFRYAYPARPWLFYVFKPLTTVAVAAVALIPGTFLSDRYAGAVALGLLFALAGDIWLMLPDDRFLLGLASFLCTHVCYALAFSAGARGAGFLWALAPLALFGAATLRYLWPALRPAWLKASVGLYMALIALMVSLAADRAVAAFSPATACAALGALLFLASDTVLAVNRFRRPFRLAQAAVLGPYFAGQLLIALSVGL